MEGNQLLDVNGIAMKVKLSNGTETFAANLFSHLDNYIFISRDRNFNYRIGV
jgi:hypothetical protein